MPSFPHLDPKADRLGGSVFSALAGRIAALSGEVYAFHIGDTWLTPPAAAAWDHVPADREPAAHRYANPHGNAGLLAAIADKLKRENGAVLCGIDNILVTPGATGALSAACRAVLSPGDEVLVLAPYWPLIRGIIELAGGKAVEVPLLHGSFTQAEAIAALRAHMSAKTVAVYVNTPCNPTGTVLEPDVLSAVAEFAKTSSLWVLSDEVYENYAFTRPHLSISSLLPFQTLSAYSCSKALGMTGYRVGYLVGPKDAMTRARKVATYDWYSVTTAAQYLAEAALLHSNDWILAARRQYEAVGQSVAKCLSVEPPQGGTFLFLNVADSLDGRGLSGLLEDALDHNLILAPGSSFGQSYDKWIRLCFTAMPPDVTLRGAAKLATFLAAKRASLRSAT